MLNKMLCVLFLQNGTDILTVVLPIVALVAGAALGFFIKHIVVKNKIGNANNVAQTIIEESKLEAKTLKKEAIIEAKEEVLKLKTESEREIKERRNEIQKQEVRLIQKEESLKTGSH